MGSEAGSKSGPAGRALVIGGTGMLAGVVEALSARGWQVSVLARGQSRLDALAELPGVTACPADYRDLAEFAAVVRSVLPVDLVVAWIHSTAPEAPLRLAQLVADPERPVAYHHVLGSSGRGFQAPTVEDFTALQGLRYHQTALGSVQELGSARWLTDAEIVAGVLRAIDTGAPQSVVGQLGAPDQPPRRV